MPTPTPREVFERLLDGVTNRKRDRLPELYAKDAVVDHPFDPRGAPPLVGREQLREHFAAIPDDLEMRAENVIVHQTRDPEVIVGEFEYHGRITTTGRRFIVPCIFVLRVRDGQIVQSKDYTHHLAFAQASGSLPALLSELAEQSPA
jgi:ketosteroid isomerase-like protein